MKEIILTMGKIATVDDEDFDRVVQFNWMAAKRKHTYYAVRAVKVGGRWTHEFLHHFLFRDKTLRDHRNGDGLDNRRNNLRPASQTENKRAFRHKTPGTTSVFRGVSWDAKNCKWRASILGEGRVRNLGRFSEESDAAKAYNTAADKFFGEFAQLNPV